MTGLEHASSTVEGSLANTLSFWGKARPGASDSVNWHPLAWHSLDVAACADVLMDIFPRLVDDLCALSHGAEIEARRLIVLMAALHDIGKFSIGFQAKCAKLYPAALGVGDRRFSGDHTSIGLRLLTDELAALREHLAPGIDRFAWGRLCGAIAGHHGRPVGSSGLLSTEIGLEAIAAARHFSTSMLDLLPGPVFSGEIGDGAMRLLSWQIAGVMNLADWIGSNQAVFHYERPEMRPVDYWAKIALPRAQQAVALAGIERPAISREHGYHVLTRLDRVPSPLQRHSETLSLPDGGPCFFLVEDLTGAGKTEAALILAHRLMQTGRGDGIFVALPTQATANAMYQRLAVVYRRMFSPDAKPSLALSHGAARLHEGFQESILDVGRFENAYGPGFDDDDMTASAACAAWIAADSRRAFFADVGVGTIDQAFLSVLPVKFAALRMLGLSKRILLLDEIHAYGAYENEELQTLIRFHAARGGSIVALSATLPERTKDKLIAAWNDGRQQFNNVVSTTRSEPGRRSKGLQSPRTERHAWKPDYPLCSFVDGGGAVSSVAISPRPDLPRSVAVCRLSTEEQAVEAILNAADAGACVAWVRNTVDDVIATDAILRARGRDPIVFHARFAMIDRQAIETEVVARFGVESTPDKRRGQIVIASQVIEQSLDIDFDLLVSDLAPIDLLIQRAGRLWRHKRPVRPLDQPRLLVLSPEPAADAGHDWLHSALPGTSYVYGNHALLWRTAAVLFEEGAIVSPGRVRPLVEAVYAQDALDAAPSGLGRRRNVAEGKEGAEASVAKMNVLKLMDGYTSSSIWSPEVRTPTRLGDERTVFRLARWQDRTLEPWAGRIDQGMSPREVERLWALSEVSVRANRASGRGIYPAEIERAASAIENTWRERGEQAVLLPIVKDHYSQDSCGVVVSKGCICTDLTYATGRGLTIKKHA